MGRVLLALLCCVCLTQAAQSLDVVMYTTDTFVQYSPAEGGVGALFCLPVDAEPVLDSTSMLVEIAFDKEVTYLSLQFYQSNIKREWSMGASPLVAFTITDGFAPVAGCVTGILKNDNDATVQYLSIRVLAEDVTLTNNPGDCNDIMLYFYGDEPGQSDLTNYYLLSSSDYYKDPATTSNIFHDLNDLSWIGDYSHIWSFSENSAETTFIPYITVFHSPFDFSNSSSSSGSNSSTHFQIEIGVSFTVLSAILLFIIISFICVVLWMIVAKRDTRRLQNYVRTIPSPPPSPESYSSPPPVVVLQTPGVFNDSETPMNTPYTPQPTPATTPKSTRFLDPRSLASPFHAMCHMRTLDLFSLAFKSRYEGTPEQSDTAPDSSV